MENRILNLLTQFIIVFFGVLLAFFANHWADERRSEKHIASQIASLVDDVKRDSANITDAIKALGDQHDSLNILLRDLEMLNHTKANANIHCTYFSYDIFEPASGIFEAMVFREEMSLENLDELRSIKSVGQMNEKLQVLHTRYYTSVESFRNSFICQHSLGYFDFAKISPEKGTEFWNRLKFMNYSVQYYYESLLIAQKKYNNFLKAYRDRHA